jgi:adenylosuccinate lyase
LMNDGGNPEALSERLFSDEARFQRWLDVEATLARAQASLGIISREAADKITAAARVERLDLARYEDLYRETGHPLVPFLRLFQAAVEGDSGQFVHLGATTQDVMDTGMMMALQEANEIFRRSLRRIESSLLELAESHADTIMVGRTHGVQALPITFGYKVAVWAREIHRSIERLQQCRERVFVLQLSGAVGTMAAFGPHGPEIQALVAQELGLGLPDICWHASRDRFAEVANLLAIAGTSLGRVAQEVYLLMATEVDELREPWEQGVVGSSTMPHKVNPQLCQTMMSLARRLRHEAALVTEVMMVDHERNLEHFLGEAEALECICRTMGELLSNGERMTAGLKVRSFAMSRNLGLLKGLLLSEAVMLELGRYVGKQNAHEIVYEDAMRALQGEATFADVLAADPRVSSHLGRPEIERLLDPQRYTGLAAQITKQAVVRSRAERGPD